MNKYEKTRDEILDQIIKLREEYFACEEGHIHKGDFAVGLLRTGNEIMKYAKTQDNLPRIPTRYLQDLAVNISICQKIQSLVKLIEKTYDITDQEREFLNSLY
jgi:hypothetical protein